MNKTHYSTATSHDHPILNTVVGVATTIGVLSMDPCPCETAPKKPKFEFQYFFDNIGKNHPSFAVNGAEDVEVILEPAEFHKSLVVSGL